MRPAATSPIQLGRTRPRCNRSRPATRTGDAIPFSALGQLSAGDALRLVLMVSQSRRDVQQLPESGPAQWCCPT